MAKSTLKRAPVIDKAYEQKCNVDFQKGLANHWNAKTDRAENRAINKVIHAMAGITSDKFKAARTFIETVEIKPDSKSGKSLQESLKENKGLATYVKRKYSGQSSEFEAVGHDDMNGINRKNVYHPEHLDRVKTALAFDN